MRSSLGLFASIYLQIDKRIMALDSCQNFVSAQYFTTECREFYIKIQMLDIDMLCVGIVMHQLVQIFNIVKPLNHVRL